MLRLLMKLNGKQQTELILIFDKSSMRKEDEISDNIFINFLNWVETTYSSIINEYILIIEKGGDKGFTIAVERLRNSIIAEPKNKPLEWILVWILYKYGSKNNFEGTSNWLDYLIDTSDGDDLGDNAANSKKNLIQFIIEKNIKTIDQINEELLDKELKEIIKETESKSRKINKAILDFEITKQSINSDPVIDGSPLPSKYDLLREELIKYGFFELQTVAVLKPDNQTTLVKSISKNYLPYSIAMFDHLGFINHLKENYFPIGRKLNMAISGMFNSDKDGRSVRGYINSLHETPTMKEGRYKAFLQKEKVQKDYQNLK